MKEIKDAVGRERGSDPKIDFDTFGDLARSSISEADAMVLLERYLQPDLQALQHDHVVLRNQLFNRLDALPDALSKSNKPDLAYGAEATNLDPAVRDRLGGSILPTGLENTVCPNFTVAARGSRGDDFVMNMQAVHDGAVAARGMQALWCFGEDAKPVEADSSSVARMGVGRSLTCTWKMGTLKMYVTYRRDYACDESQDRPPKASNSPPNFPTYITCLVGIWNMMEREEDLESGVAAYRNAMEWAKGQRDEAIARANRREVCGLNKWQEDT
ncbi:hypothetical protein KVR01_007852 [Diaporthe batatas]|uniref:uncharacterized protein n=1 Tax=Diaporthe batatas TaxID=748121 RepID=UPI001D0479AD|nr:uncharacterized protein KVR01_007852 [Diaporthe batatas]KAG8162087.1 hypothetical protein KVR01_007852 [Diaporthe batatas]